MRAKTCHQTSRHPEWEFEQSKNFDNDILGGFERKQSLLSLRYVYGENQHIYHNKNNFKLNIAEINR